MKALAERAHELWPQEPRSADVPHLKVVLKQTHTEEVHGPVVRVVADSRPGISNVRVLYNNYPGNADYVTLYREV